MPVLNFNVLQYRVTSLITLVLFLGPWMVLEGGERAFVSHVPL